MRKIFSFWTLFTLIIFLWVGNAYSVNVTLEWDANTEPDIAGYKIYYGPASREYIFFIHVGNQTNYTVTNLSEGTTYFFAVTAYNSFGESGFSNEVLFSTPKADSEADLEIIEKINPDAITAGCNINLGFAVFNNGPDNAENAEINIMLGQGVLLDSVSEKLCNYYALEGRVVCNLGKISNGEEIEFEIIATTHNSDGSITTYMEATSDTQDPILENNEYSKNTKITYLPCDLNCDNKINDEDLFYFISVVGTKEGDANYDPRANVDGDDVVSFFDYTHFFRDCYF